MKIKNTITSNLPLMTRFVQVLPLLCTMLGTLLNGMPFGFDIRAAFNRMEENVEQLQHTEHARMHRNPLIGTHAVILSDTDGSVLRNLATYTAQTLDMQSEQDS